MATRAGASPDGGRQRVARTAAADETRQVSDNQCGFCEQERFRTDEVYIENEFCLFFASRDPVRQEEAGLPPEVLPLSGVIIPRVHRISPFDLTTDEWVATHDLLVRARAALHELIAPDGYTIGWNAMGSLHAHLHVIPRFRDEPMWDRGMRSAIKVPENRRQDPWRPGTGRALSGL